MLVDNARRIRGILFVGIGRVTCATALFLGVQLVASAGDITVNAGVSAELVDQQIKTKDAPQRDIDVVNFIVKPYASLSYQARDFDIFIRGTHNNVRRKLDDETTTQNYTTYNYSSNYDIIKNVLTLSANGNRGYRNNSLNRFISDDFLLNGDSLSKISSDGANLRLNIRRGEFYGLSANSSYRHFTSEINTGSTPSENDFTGESYGFSFNAISGTNLEGAQVSLSTNVQYSKRGERQDFVSQQVGLSGDIEIYGDFGLALNGRYENNEFKTDFETDTDTSRLREFYSYGAGIIWQPRSDRFIKVLLNRSLTPSVEEDIDDEEDSFLSYNINWAFSERTSIQGNYTRRFFGDAGNLSFRHRTKHWRSSLSYSEIVSSNSQLINSNDIGLFICADGSTDIADCRLSDTLEPELEPGEALQPFLVQNPIVNDRVILRKSLTAQTAVTRRRTTLSFTANRSENDEIEVNRIFDITTLRASIDFALSHNISLKYGYTLGKTELDQDGEFESATTKRHSLELKRKITKRFTTAISLSYLDRDGEINRGTQSLRGLNGPLTDRRVTFRVSYALRNR